MYKETFWKAVGRLTYVCGGLRGSDFISWRERLLAGDVCVGFDAMVSSQLFQ